MTYLSKHLRNRELGNKKSVEKYINYIQYMQYVCKEDHIYGYAPHVYNGQCRFCCGKQSITFSEFKKLRI